jgi:D-methionine transport system ATP-binding protein
LRTLVHDLPADLAERVKPLHDIAQADARILLDVRFTGVDAREPDLGGLASALSADGGRVSFVHGGIDRIQGHAQGRLVVSAQVRANADTTVQQQIATLLDRARRYANHVEVLGYV